MVENTHTKYQDNPAIFKDNEFWGWGGVSENGQNSSSNNVPEYIHTKFQDNRTKFQDFGIFGGSPPLGGEGGGGNSEN